MAGVSNALVGNWEVLRAVGETRNEQDLHGCDGSLADHGLHKLSPDAAGRAEEQCVSLSHPVPGQDRGSCTLQGTCLQGHVDVRWVRARRIRALIRGEIEKG